MRLPKKLLLLVAYPSLWDLGVVISMVGLKLENLKACADYFGVKHAVSLGS